MDNSLDNPKSVKWCNISLEFELKYHSTYYDGKMVIMWCRLTSLVYNPSRLDSTQEPHLKFSSSDRTDAYVIFVFIRFYVHDRPDNIMSRPV